jgi:polar amino acid transport system substrate-binding protein
MTGVRTTNKDGAAGRRHAAEGWRGATREPFCFVDKDGRVTGHDGELARIIALKLRPIEFSNEIHGADPALQSGKVDIIVTG